VSAFVLIRADAATTLLRDDPIVRAGEVAALREANALLAAATAMRDGARRANDTAAEQARAAGYAAGRAEGLAAGAAEVRAELLRLAQADAERAERQRGDLARLGVEVVRRIAAELGAPAMVAALADKAAASVAPDLKLTVRVSPAAVERTRDRLGAQVAVEPDETLEATDCVLATPLGEVRAGLETQLAQLAKHWGVA
jgi:type III secretion protein L